MNDNSKDKQNNHFQSPYIDFTTHKGSLTRNDSEFVLPYKIPKMIKSSGRLIYHINIIFTE